MTKGEFKKFWNKYGQHFYALSIIVLLTLIWISYSHNNQLQKEISENCGWGKEDYHCDCEKGEAIAIKNKLENQVDTKLTFNLSAIGE